MNENWGLTEYGFLRPTYNELLDAYEMKARELFGSNTNLTVRSPLGIFLRIFAWFSGIAWQLAEDVYNSGYIDTAAGVSLSRLGAYIGIRRLSAQKATGILTITGDVGARVYAGFIAQTNNNQRFVTLENVILGANGTGNVPIQAYVAGPDGNVAAGSIDTIVTPLATVISVTNAAVTTGGRNRETDQEFRERYLQSVDKPGGSNSNSIRAEILEVPSVITAAVWENETDLINENGLPPHSIEAIVYGGTDADVAKAVHARKAAGIETYGTSSVQVLDASGQMKTIRFSRPAVVNIYIKITALVTDSSFAGNDSIKDALIQFVGSDDADITGSGLDIGESVYYNRLMCPLNAVPGVVDYTMEIGADGITYAKSNIAITARQKAIASAERIVISS